MKFAKMPEEPELPPPPVIEPPEPEPESAATPLSSSPASDDNEADRAEQLSQLQQQVLLCSAQLFCLGSRDGAVLGAFVSHHCGLCSNSRVDTIYRLSFSSQL